MRHIGIVAVFISITSNPFVHNNLGDNIAVDPCLFFRGIVILNGCEGSQNCVKRRCFDFAQHDILVLGQHLYYCYNLFCRTRLFNSSTVQARRPAPTAFASAVKLFSLFIVLLLTN